jgi:hypothetical protein
MAGDPTITVMGTEKPFEGRMRVGVDYLERSETVGVSGVSDVKTDEERITYNFSYSLNVDWMFAVSIPTVTKKIKRYDLSSQTGSGLGDADLSARWFIGKGESFMRHNLWGMQFGIRLPTSEEEKSNGVPIDIDAQPGAGATIPSIGIWYGKYVTPWFFYFSGIFKHAIDEGYQGYKAGDVLLGTAMGQYAVNEKLAVQVGFDGRYKKKDKFYDTYDDDSGGILVMAAFGMAWTPIEDLVINFNYQTPAIENPNGDQEEDATFRIGVAYDF